MQTLVLGLRRQRWQVCVNLRSVWSTERVPHQPGLTGKIPFPNKKNEPTVSVFDEDEEDSLTDELSSQEQEEHGGAEFSCKHFLYW